MLQVVMVLVSYFQKIILKSLPWESEIIIRYTAVPLLSSSTEMFTARNSIDHWWGEDVQKKYITMLCTIVDFLDVHLDTGTCLFRLSENFRV